MSWPRAFTISSIFAFALITTVSTLPADAAIVARAVDSLNDVESTEVYAIEGTTTASTAEDIIVELGKRIRQTYHIRGFDIHGYSHEQSSMQTALTELQEKTGEFPGLSKDEQSAIQTWATKHAVERVERLDLNVNYMGGTGLETIYLFIPKMPAVEVLAVRAFWYSE